MTALRKYAMDLLERIPEDKLHYVVQIMQEINDLHGKAEQTARDKAFERLESFRRKDTHLDDEEYLNRD